MEVRGTESRLLWDFVNAYRMKKLVLPEHQKLRGDVWPLKKKQMWWKKIEEVYKQDIAGTWGHNLSGVITTYHLHNDPSNTLYMNDGANRTIHSILAYIGDCESKGKDWETILKTVKISNQQIVYRDKAEAIRDFIDINSKGTMATPYEILSTMFCSVLPDFGEVWEPIISSIHKTVENTLMKVGSFKQSNREKAAVLKRDNLAMFVRFVNKEKTKWSPPVTNQIIDYDNTKHKEVETKALEIFQRLGPIETKAEVERFGQFLDKRAALYRQVQLEYGKAFVRQTETIVRWWLNYTIYHYNNEFDSVTLGTYIRKFFELHNGRSTMHYKDQNGIDTHITTKLQNIANITTIYRALGMNTEDMEYKNVRKAPKEKAQDGFVQSHKDPHCRTYGTPELLVENGYENAHRSAAPMNDDEYERIKKANSPKT